LPTYTHIHIYLVFIHSNTSFIANIYTNIYTHTHKYTNAYTHTHIYLALIYTCTIDIAVATQSTTSIFFYITRKGGEHRGDELGEVDARHAR